MKKLFLYAAIAAMAMVACSNFEGEKEANDEGLEDATGRNEFLEMSDEEIETSDVSFCKDQNIVIIDENELPSDSDWGQPCVDSGIVDEEGWSFVGKDYEFFYPSNTDKFFFYDIEKDKLIIEQIKNYCGIKVGEFYCSYYDDLLDEEENLKYAMMLSVNVFTAKNDPNVYYASIVGKLNTNYVKEKKKLLGRFEPTSVDEKELRQVFINDSYGKRLVPDFVIDFGNTLTNNKFYILFHGSKYFFNF